MPNRTWVLYGAGEVGRSACVALQKLGHNVIGFIDRNAKINQNVCGLPVYRLEQVPLNWRCSRCAITIFNRDVHAPEVKKILEGAGWAIVDTYLDLFYELDGALSDRFWLVSRAKYFAARQEWEKAETIWVDEKSRQLFRIMMEMRMRGVYPSLPMFDESVTQYMPLDVPRWVPDKVVTLIDGGAYDGQSILRMIAAGLPVQNIFAFEPETKNFPLLASSANDLREKISGFLMLMPCGLAKNSCQLRFSEGTGESSHVSDSGGSTIQCVAIDDMIHDIDVGMVKLDIEGCESDALEGMSRTIHEFNPRLAVSAYHLWDDLWRLPEIIERIAPDIYDFSLRAHGNEGFDAVIYAVPKLKT